MSVHKPTHPDASGSASTSDPPGAAAILLAAGTPFLWAPLLGRPLLAWPLGVVEQIDAVEQIVLAVAADRAQDAQSLAEAEGWRKTRIVAIAGDWREALRAGLDVLTAESAQRLSSSSLIVVHEAARPLITAELVVAGLTAASKTGAAVAGEPVKETIKRVRENRIVETVPRENLIRAQTPLVLTDDALRTALTAFPPVPASASPLAFVPAALAAGMRMTTFPGSPENYLVQTDDDLAVAAALLRRRLNTTT